VIGGKAPRLATTTPPVGAEDFQGAKAGEDGAWQAFALREFALALGALAGRGVGFDLRGALGQQALGFAGGGGDLLFDMAQVLLGVLRDDPQARLQIGRPRLDFGRR
jgi:hypothetical protein